MLLQSTFIILLATSVLLAMILAFYAWLRREVAGAWPFIIIMAGAVVWGVAYIFEILGSSLDVKIFWDNVKISGMDFVVLGMIVFVLVYTGRARLVQRYWWLLLIEPVLDVIMLWTEPWHGWMRVNPYLNQSGLFTVLDYGHKPLMWTFILYAQSLTFISLVLLVMQYFRQQHIYRRQAAILLVGALLPLAGSLLTIKGWVPIDSMHHLDITPITLSITSLLWAMGLFYFRILDIMPVVRQTVFDDVEDAIFVLDTDWCVVDLNLFARRLTNQTAQAVIGQPLLNFLPGLVPFLNGEDAKQELQEFSLLIGAERCIFSVKRTPIYDHRNILTGCLFVLMDITKLKRAEEQTLIAREVAETLREIGVALSATLDYDALLDRMLELIERLVPYDSANILLVENKYARTKRTRGYEKYGAGTPEKVAKLALNIVETDNLKWMVENQEPLIVPDIDADPGWRKDGAGSKFRSWLGVPILTQGNVVAFFSLGKCEPGFYSQKHAQVLATFATQAALAMENARLYTQSLLDLRREQHLNTAMRAINRAMETEAILEQSIQLIFDLFSPDRVEIGLLIPGGDFDCHNYILNAAGLVEKREIMVPGKQTFSWWLLDSSEPVLVNDSDLLHGVSDDLRDHAVSSIIGVPLMDGSRHFGILCMLLNGDGKKFNAHDLSLADSIGHQINIAILNARLFKDIQRLAITDPLTGWYNRRHIFELAQNELERSQRYDHPMAVIMLDIDWFKQINDTHGHLVGDQVLQAIARRIEKNLRKPDIGGRYGGEEFIILLPETGIIAAQQAAERIRVTVSNQPIATTKGVIPVTISLGVSGIQGGHGLIAEKLMDMADQAMYAAKRAGRDRVAVWREGGIHEILPLSRS